MKTDDIELTEAADPLAATPAWDDIGAHEGPSFFAKHRVAVSIVAAAALGVLAWKWNVIFPKQHGPAARRENMVIVNVPPPPPPPPPPPVVQPPPPPVEEKMIEQTPVENEPKPEQAPDEPPAADLGTGIKGDGPPDGFGLSGSGSGRSNGTGSGNQQQRSRWGWYAGQVQSRIQQAVQTNRRTRAASIRAEVKVWADSTGRITRAKLTSTTGDAALDATLRDEVLAGLQLSEPPPEGMPMPINLRITARRP